MEKKFSKKHPELLYTLLILLAGLCVYLFAGAGKCAVSSDSAAASARIAAATPQAQAAAPASGVPEAVFRTALESGGFYFDLSAENTCFYEDDILLSYEMQEDTVICATLLVPLIAAAPESTDTLIEQSLVAARQQALQAQAACLQDALVIVVPAIDPDQSATRANIYQWHALLLKARDGKTAVEDTQGCLTFSAFWSTQAGEDVLVVSIAVER